MSTGFHIASSDPQLLQQATHIANRFADGYRREGVVGVVFLGAIARGYFDRSADIDIAVFKRQDADLRLDSQFLQSGGFEVHCHLSDYETELSGSWDMAKRWTYEQGQIVFDPEGLTAQLLAEKVPLKEDERRWLLMSGLALSEWYVHRLSRLWIQRGNMTSAHLMFTQGLNYFLQMLFGLNHELVPDMKWQFYCAEQLPRLPADFTERVRAMMTVREFTSDEVEGRRSIFMRMWREMLPAIERELGMSYAEINALV
jgi:hypothetical protein